MLNLINKILKLNTSINKNEELMAAVQNKNLKMVNFWIINGAAVNISNRYGNTPLMEAAKKGHCEVVKLLLVHNADVNVSNQAGDTALILAVQNGCCAVVNLLLMNNADVNVSNHSGNTPLMLANDYSEIVNLINKIEQLKEENLANVQTSINEITNILLTVEENCNDAKVIESIIKIIYNYGFHINTKLKNTNSKLNKSLKSQFINKLIFGEENYSLLHLAVLNDWQKLVSYLINNWPVDIDFKDSSGNSAWNHACLLLQKENALLIKNKKDINEQDIKFLKEIIPLSKEWTIEKKKSNKIINKNRTEIFEYYLSKLAINKAEDTNSLEYFKKESNTINLQTQAVISEYSQPSTLKM